MSRATLNRLAKLKAFISHRGGLVCDIPAHSDEEFREKGAAFTRDIGRMPLTFVRVHKFTQTEAFTTSRTRTDLLAHIAMNGRRVHDYRRNAQ